MRSTLDRVYKEESTGTELKSKFMVYTEIPVDQLTIVLQSPDMMARCDVIALLYENERD